MAVPSLLAVLPGGGLEPAGPLVPCPTEDAAPSVRSTAPAVAPRDDNPIRQLPPTPAPAADGDSAALRPMSLSVPIEPTPNHILAEIDTLVLMGGWRRGEAGAEAELRRRGFGPVEFDLATRMLDGNASTRRELAGLLPQMTSVQPTPWLLWLARDDDADVRLTAVATLATSSDPATLEAVERLARDDRDARIRRCGEQISQRRTGKVKW
jgi:hypothetical protein